MQNVFKRIFNVKYEFTYEKSGKNLKTTALKKVQTKKNTFQLQVILQIGGISPCIVNDKYCIQCLNGSA